MKTTTLRYWNHWRHVEGLWVIIQVSGFHQTPEQTGTIYPEHGKCGFQSTHVSYLGDDIGYKYQALV